MSTVNQRKRTVSLSTITSWRQLSIAQLRALPRFVRLSLAVAEIQEAFQEFYTYRNWTDKDLRRLPEWPEISTARLVKRLGTVDNLAGVLYEKELWLLRWWELYNQLKFYERHHLVDKPPYARRYIDPDGHLIRSVRIFVMRFQSHLRKADQNLWLDLYRARLTPPKADIKQHRDYDRAALLMEFAQFHYQNVIVMMRPPGGNPYSGEMHTISVLGPTLNFLGKTFKTSEVWGNLIENSFRYKMGTGLTTEPIGSAQLRSVGARRNFLKALLKHELDPKQLLPRWRPNPSVPIPVQDQREHELQAQQTCFTRAGYTPYHKNDPTRMATVLDYFDATVGIMKQHLSVAEQRECQWYRQDIEKHMKFLVKAPSQPAAATSTTTQKN